MQSTDSFEKIFKRIHDRGLRAIGRTLRKRRKATPIVTTGAEASISRIQTVTSWRSSLVRTEAEAGIHSRVLAKVAMALPPKLFPVSLHAASARFSMLSATPRVRRCR